MYNFSNLKKGETLVSVVVGIVILGIAMGGVAMILVQNSTIEEDYGKNNNVFFLQSNAENIVRRVDTSAVIEKEVFFLRKDPLTRTFLVYTGTTNEGEKYIDRDGNKIDAPTSYPGTVYTRSFIVERQDTSFGDKPRQVIKGGIKELIRK